MVEKGVEIGKEFQFESIKQRIEGIVDQVVQQKCADISAYDSKQG